MLSRCNLEIKEQGVPLKALEETIAKELGGIKNPPVFIETFGQVTLLPLDKIVFADILPDLRQMIVFTPTVELRFTYSNGIMFGRILRETEGSDYAFREDKLLLRAGSTREADWYQNGRGRVLNREYYKQDDDGIYTFQVERLAGIAS